MAKKLKKNIDTATLTNKTKWGIDPAHSEIAFKAKHLMITNIKGVFKEFDAGIYITDEDFITSGIDFRMNPASVDTGNEKRDEHLKGQDFFDVENYKMITFTGNKFKKANKNGNYTLYGDLTIKGITKQIKLDVEFEGLMTDLSGNEKAGYIINGKIKRKDWGLNWNEDLEAGGVLVSDVVRINCELQMVKQS